MGNCSQVNNTTIKGTSAVTYDSTPLPCTDVNTCDGLNTILSKFDTIICDIKANVDVLTEDVMNITEDVMVITEDITNINNQLDICCPTTTTTTTLPPTTTTTTTVEPTTTTTTSSSSTSTTTSTSTTATPTTTTTSSTSTTTTTTTVVCDCYTYRVTVTIDDLNASDNNQVEVTIPLTCDNFVNQKVSWDTEGSYDICVNSSSNAPFQYISVDSILVLTEQQPNNTYSCCN